MILLIRYDTILVCEPTGAPYGILLNGAIKFKVKN